MTRFYRIAILFASAAIALPAAVGAQDKARGGLSVISSGSEQALSLDGTTLSRPFGAAMIDRLAVAGRYSGSRGEHYYLVRGDVAGPCASRYVIVHQRAGQTPLVSAPFGTCAAGATARVADGRLIVWMPAGAPGTPLVRYAYAQGSVAPLDPTIVAAFVPEGTVLTCPVDEAVAASAPESLAASLERDFPQEFRRSGSVARLDITAPEMREMVARLACLSMQPGADPLVYKAAAPLFASRRYGHRAFDALDAVRRTPGADTTLTTSAQAFSAQMNYFVGRREPL